MAEISHGRHREGTLGALEAEVMFLQHGQDRLEVLQMHGPGRAVDEYIIKKHQNKLMKERPKHGVRQTLERRQRVREPEGHHQELEVALMGLECCFLNVLGVHPHLVVP
jgi:hypothetical protein